MKEFIYLIPLFPLLGFLINGLFWKSMPKKLAGGIGTVAVLASFILALGNYFQLDPNSSGYTFTLFEFITAGKLQIPFSFRIDQLSSLFLLIITGIGTLIHLYSIGYMSEDEGYTKYFAYLNFFVFSMLLLVMGGNYAIMFIGWEGVGLASYLLIGFWFENKSFTNAGKKAFIMNRIGDLGFLVGMLLVLYHFGTIEYDQLFATMPQQGIPTSTMNLIAFAFFIGAMGKSAQIPLYTWLPDAMAGPTPVSALIHAATMVTAGIYMIARSSVLYNLAPFAQDIVAIIGIATALVAASIALKQNDIKKVLAYSTVSQLGYMFLALGVGSYVGGVFHVMTHAFFKALLFLGAGAVIHNLSGEQDIRKMGGLAKKMPITHITFVIACLAIAGIPGFSGFFSKDQILVAAYAKNPIYFYLGLLGAAMTAFYMFRLYFLTFTGKYRGNLAENEIQESPKVMTIPLIVLAVLSVIGGFVGLPHLFGAEHKLANFLAPIVEDFQVGEVAASTEWFLMGLSVVVVLVMIFLAKSQTKTGIVKEEKGFGKFLQEAWYVDEVYQAIIVSPLKELSQFFSQVMDKNIIDGVVNGLGKIVQAGSNRLRLLQNGQVGFYFFVFVIGIFVLLVLGLWYFPTI